MTLTIRGFGSRIHWTGLSQSKVGHIQEIVCNQNDGGVSILRGRGQLSLTCCI